MDFEDRIRWALKQDAKHIHVSPNARSRLVERIEHPSNFKKWPIAISAAVVLLFGANSIVSAATGQSLFRVIVHYTSASKGGAFGSGFGLVPLTRTPSNSTVTAAAGTSHQPSANLANATGQPSAAPANAISEAVVRGNGFEDIRYDDRLAGFLGTSQYPRLNMNNLQVNHVGANLINKAQKKFDITADAVISGTRNENVSLFLYHNQRGTIRFDGETTAENKQSVRVNGEDAAYLAFTNGWDVENYVTWNRGPWIVVLRGMDVPEATLLQIASGVDQQAQVDG
jgi:hypothetical protein